MKHIPLTSEMIDECPAVDIHVHVPGTITPQTAWDLGLRNGLITMFQDEQGIWKYKDGPNAIAKTDPVGAYSNIFCSKGGFGLKFDEKSHPIDLDYNYACLGAGHDKFSGFDAIQGTTQGHRHRPGGIQTQDDYRFVMQRYLESCLRQNIRYSETSQNITIASVLYPDATPQEARKRFFHLCHEIVDAFAAQNVHLRFYHCANKTSQANVAGGLAKRANEWADWLAEAQKTEPGIFVGLTTAGHEELEKQGGGPQEMQDAYARVHAMGLGCEGHYGEGIGVEHMLAALACLPEATRFAHGVQVLESKDAIDIVRGRGIPLVMMPCINLSLGSAMHYKDGAPHAKYLADGTRDPSVITRHITRLEEHPFFPLMREHGLRIALASDDPEQGGMSYKAQAKLLSGIGYTFPPDFRPLSGEELALCNLNAIDAAFCEPALKKELADNVKAWMKKYNISIS